MRVAIVGYGKLGRAVELLIRGRSEFELAGIFSRRWQEYENPYILPQEALFDFDSIDCAMLCLGSSGDMVEFAPKIARKFNTVDTYDNHARIREYYGIMNENANKTCHSSLISSGWDPGFLSAVRCYAHSFLQKPYVNTVWGRGVSQGHSEVLRTIRGVQRALAITVPNSAVTSTLLHNRIFTTCEELHTRLCVIVADKPDREYIVNVIKGYPDYFAPYRCDIRFVSDEEFDSEYAQLSSHCGQIIASGVSGVYEENYSRIYASIECDSNPQLTAGILLASALAVCRLNKEKRYGAFTPLDVPPSYFLYGKDCFDFL